MSSKVAKLDSLWNVGVFVGYRSPTGEYVVVTPEGAWKTRALQRQPEEERWRREDVESMKCTRSATNDDAMTKESSLEERVDRDLGHDIPPKAPEPAEAIPRRVYITRQTLEKYGKMPECAGCTKAFLVGTGVNHTESCQMRVESAMKDDTVDRHRVRNAKRKIPQFVQEHRPDNLKKLDRNEGDRMDDCQEVPSLPSNPKSSSSSAIPAGTKRSAEQDAEDLRQGDNESPRTGTKRTRDPYDRENRGGMLIGCTVSEEADLEKSWSDFEVLSKTIVMTMTGRVRSSKGGPTWRIPTRMTCLQMRCTMIFEASNSTALLCVRRA